MTGKLHLNEDRNEKKWERRNFISKGVAETFPSPDALGFEVTGYSWESFKMLCVTLFLLRSFTDRKFIIG